MKHGILLTGILVSSFAVFGQDSPAVDTAAAAQADTAAAESASSDLSLWEVGGMYFGLPYVKKTFEADINGWYEGDEPGISLYAAYALTDNFTLKLEVPFAFSSPVTESFKITGLFGKQWDGEAALSADLSLDTWYGEEPEIIPVLGLNGAKRWGIFALLGRASGGADVYLGGDGGYDPRAEVEVAPFVYTGEIGMVGLPVMYEYTYGESVLNIALDWELYLPLNLSLSLVPRYEVINNGGFSGWFSLAWMMMPE